MTCAGSSLVAARSAASYEALRAAVLNGSSGGQRGLAILIHRGLAAWIREATAEKFAPTTPLAASPSEPADAAVPAPGTGELTRVLAGIVLTLTAGSAHARP
jgi:hypothetical protein